MSLSWPPAYSIRISQRARRLILQFSPRTGLEVIVPQHLKRRSLDPQADIDALLTEKRRWVERALAQYQPASPLVLPTTLNLLGIQKTIQLQYKPFNNDQIKMLCTFCGKKLAARPCPHEAYSLAGPIEDYKKVFNTLRKFLKIMAIHFLAPWLRELSLETGLIYTALSFRRQSTLWGSCTAAKKISLNIHLLFLPAHLVRYVLLHELCHLQHLNHSKRYWQLLKKFDPHCLQHRKSLLSAMQYLPAWLHA